MKLYRVDITTTSKLNNGIVHKAKVLLPQAFGTLTDFCYPVFNHILGGRRDNVPTVDGFTHINVINI
jgi:hypothetical protein